MLCQPEAAGKADAVGIRHHGRQAVHVAADEIGRFSADVRGFNKFLARYRKALDVERAACDVI